jgi:hypothetical protein
MALIGLMLLVAACASPYQPRNWKGIGYSDSEIQPGRYYVEYAGYFESMPTVADFWFQRAKELCPTGFSAWNPQMTGPPPRIDRQKTVGAGGFKSTGGLFEYTRYAGHIQCAEGPGAPTK